MPLNTYAAGLYAFAFLLAGISYILSQGDATTPPPTTRLLPALLQSAGQLSFSVAGVSCLGLVFSAAWWLFGRVCELLEAPAVSVNDPRIHAVNTLLGILSLLSGLVLMWQVMIYLNI